MPWLMLIKVCNESKSCGLEKLLFSIIKKLELEWEVTVRKGSFTAQNNSHNSLLPFIHLGGKNIARVKCLVQGHSAINET